MPNMTFTLQVKGTDEIKNALAKLGDRAVKALGAALYEEGQGLITDAQQVVPVDLGTLRASGTVTLPEIEGEAVVVEAGFGGPAAPYALYVHEGTGPAVGRPQYWPPIAALEDWARSHGFDSPYAVQWAIHEHGTKLTKFLEEPFNRRASGFDNRIAQRLKVAIGL